MSLLLAPCCLIIGIIFIIGLIIYMLLHKKGNKKVALIGIIITISIVLIMIGIILYGLVILSVDAEKYEIDLTITNVNTEFTEEINLTVYFGDKEKTISGTEIHYKTISIDDVKEGKRYYFEIKSQNLRFINNNKSISGLISIYKEKLIIENITGEPGYYEIIQENDHIEIRTTGVEGSIIFEFNLDDPVVE